MREGPVQREPAAERITHERDLRGCGRFGDQREVRLDGIVAEVSLMTTRAVSGQVGGVETCVGGKKLTN